MSDPQLKAELEALKAQLSQMSRRVAAADSPGGVAGSSESSTLDEVRKLAESVDAPQLIEQASEFLKGLGKDVQDSKPKALVAAFVAGFVAGRVTGR
jgi:hypothetical protein